MARPPRLELYDSSDAASRSRSALAGLVPHEPDAARLDYLDEKFSRHVNLPSRRIKGHIEIFGDEILPEESAQAQPHTWKDTRGSTGMPGDYGDIME